MSMNMYSGAEVFRHTEVYRGIQALRSGGVIVKRAFTCA
ncbi:hypothetical protein GA0115259_100305 [Streptomyces sp. MnatMP-M17]|nr:hypothetical protein GA0115259_100305 [Streptomyces sp. MnatMP-M17]